MSLDGAELEPDDVDLGEATRDRVFVAAERLFATHGFQAVSVRDITTEAGVNLAAVNYHFGSKDGLLFEIFRRRSIELNRARARMLHEATDAHEGKPPLRAILTALITPSVQWLDPAGDKLIALQFLIRARSEGTEPMRESLRKEVSQLQRFSEAFMAALPHLSAEEVYWRLHFTLGVIHQNRSVEFERLAVISGGLTRHADVAALAKRMIDYAEAGFRA